MYNLVLFFVPIQVLNINIFIGDNTTIVKWERSWILNFLRVKIVSSMIRSNSTNQILTLINARLLQLAF